MSENPSFIETIREIATRGMNHSTRGNVTSMLTVPVLEWICKNASEIFRQEPNVVHSAGKSIVIGDIHGQMQDLTEILCETFEEENANYVFLGDYVDRGPESLEVISLIFCLKILYPNRFYVLRGNHESRAMTRIHGFMAECEEKANTNVYQMFCKAFDTLPLVCIIDNSVFCVHGGLSRYIETIKEINDIDRFVEIPKFGPMTDLLWSDPDEDVKEYKKSSRGYTFLFGEKVAKKFLSDNNLSLITRAHEMFIDGYDYPFSEKILVTIFSSSNYSNFFNNDGAYMVYDGKVNIKKLPVHASADQSEYSDSF